MAYQVGLKHSVGKLDINWWSQCKSVIYAPIVRMYLVSVANLLKTSGDSREI